MTRQIMLIKFSSIYPLNCIFLLLFLNFGQYNSSYASVFFSQIRSLQITSRGCTYIHIPHGEDFKSQSILLHLQRRQVTLLIRISLNKDIHTCQDSNMKWSFCERRTFVNIRISEDLIPMDQENIEMHNFSHMKRIQKLFEETVPVFERHFILK